MPLILPNTIANAIPADGDKLQQNFATIVDWANQDAIVSDGSTAMTAPLLLPGAPTQPNQAATKAYVDGSVPVGVIWMYGGANVPNANWMFCRGQAISRATYAALYAVFSTTYGPGDGVTTFALPDLRMRVPMGLQSGGGYAGTLGLKGGSAEAALPSHTHTMSHNHPSANTGNISASHKHALRGQAMNGGSGTVGLNLIADDSLTQYPVIASTANQDADHHHQFDVPNFNGSTAAAGSTTNYENNPPYLAINWIVKVL